MKKILLIFVALCFLVSCDAPPKEYICDEKIIYENPDCIYTMYVFLIYVRSIDILETRDFNESISVDVQNYEIEVIKQFNGEPISTTRCFNTMTNLYDTDTKEEVYISVAELLELEVGKTSIVLARDDSIGVSTSYQDMYNIRHATVISDYDITLDYNSQSYSIIEEIEDIVETYKEVVPFPF